MLLCICEPRKGCFTISEITSEYKWIRYFSDKGFSRVHYFKDLANLEIDITDSVFMNTNKLQHHYPTIYDWSGYINPITLEIDSLHSSCIKDQYPELLI